MLKAIRSSEQRKKKRKEVDNEKARGTIIQSVKVPTTLSKQLTIKH
jgi:hypothetical protein